MTSAPLPPDELQRLQALWRYQVLDTLPEEAFDRVARLAAHALDMPVAIVNFVDEHRQWGKACRGVTRTEAPRHDSLCAWAILSDDVMVVPNAREDARFAQNPMVTGEPYIHLYAGAPLITPDGHAVGTLCVTDDRPHPFGEREKTILRELAAVIVDELELRAARAELEREATANAQMLQSLRRETLYAETLLAVNALLELGLEPKEMTRHAVELVARAADLDWGGLLVATGDRAEILTSWHQPGVNETYLNHAANGVKRGEGVVWQVLQRGEPLFVGDYSSLAAAMPAFVQAGVRGAAWVPLGAFGGAAFMLCAVRTNNVKPWSRQERVLFEAAARSVSIALERGEYLRQLQVAALSDPLTGLGNRGAFDAHLEHLLQGSESVSIALIELHGLTEANDRHGREHGDALLRAFASVLGTAVSSGERAYRFGGNDFALILRGSQASPPDVHLHAERRVARVVEVVRRHGFPECDAQFAVSSAPAEGRYSAELLRVAHERLYGDQPAAGAR